MIIFLILITLVFRMCECGCACSKVFSLGMVLISMLIMSIINYYVIIIFLSKKVYSVQLHFHKLLPSIFTRRLICSKADFTSLSCVKIGIQLKQYALTYEYKLKAQQILMKKFSILFPFLLDGTPYYTLSLYVTTIFPQIYCVIGNLHICPLLVKKCIVVIKIWITLCDKDIYWHLNANTLLT